MSLYAKVLHGLGMLFLVFNLVPSLSAECRQVGGALITNFGGVDANTTLGPASGDLSGAVAASIIGVAPGANGTTVFTVLYRATPLGDRGRPCHLFQSSAGHGGTGSARSIRLPDLRRSPQRWDREVHRCDRDIALYRRSRPERRNHRAPVQRQSVLRSTVTS